jgi:hypothetical protein
MFDDVNLRFLNLFTFAVNAEVRANLRMLLRVPQPNQSPSGEFCNYDESR